MELISLAPPSRASEIFREHYNARQTVSKEEETAQSFDHKHLDRCPKGAPKILLAIETVVRKF